jgi:hypothetical protein
MEAIFCSERSVDFHRATGHHIPEDETLNGKIIMTDELGVPWNGESCLLLKCCLNNCLEGLRKAIYRVPTFGTSGRQSRDDIHCDYYDPL